MKCPKCGYFNDEDAKYCEKCRFNIQSNYSGNIIENKGMSTLTKALIVLCIVIVGVLGVTTGFMFQNVSSNPEESEVLTEEKEEIINQTINLISQTRTEDISRPITTDSNSEVHSDYGIKKCVVCGIPFDDFGYGWEYCHFCWPQTSCCPSY